MAGGQALFPGEGLGETFSHEQLFTEERAVNKFLVVKIYSSLTFFNDEKKQATQTPAVL